MPRAHRSIAAALIAASLVVMVPTAPRAAAATLPSGFSEVAVFTGLTHPTVVAFAANGRVFVAEKSGLIKVFSGLDDPTPAVFADLRAQVHNYWDRGLLGMALHPSFPSTPYVYVVYSRDAPIGGSPPTWGDACPNPPGATADGCVISARLSRLQASGDVMTGGEHVLIDDWCQQYPSHTVGSLAFGPDGMLYVSAGDGASFNWVDYGQDGNPLNPCGDPPGGVGAALTPPTAEGGALRSQDLRTSADPTGLDGSILRIDPATGAAPADNPGVGDANARRIIATGLRNPFRMTFRPGTSELWLGDVGWADYEEINRLANRFGAIENYGWPCFEGPGRQSGYDAANLAICESLYATPSAVTSPWYSYSHAEEVVQGESCGTGGSSITGLAFYPGGAYPDVYDGALFFADYSRNCIWVATRSPTSGELPDPAQRATFVAAAATPIQLTIGPGGDLYYVDFLGGTIRRIRYVPGNGAPTAVAAANPTSGAAPLTVAFNGSGSSDPDGDALTYAWDLDGDGAYDDASGVTASRTYTSPGQVTASLRVTDVLGADAEDDVLISVGNTPPAPVIDLPAAGTRWAAGDQLSFAGHANDAQDGALGASRLDWELILHHCEGACHQHPIQAWDGVASGTLTAPDHEYPSWLELRLTATDSHGLAATVSRQLDPRTVVLTFDSAPGGLQIAVGDEQQAAPFTTTVIVGSTQSITAPDQVVGGTEYTFVSWNDGGAQSHSIVAPASPATYRATFIGSSPGEDPPAFTPDPGDVMGWEGQPVTIDLDAVDPEGTDITWSATGLPSWLTLDADTGRLTGTPSSAGAGTSSITATATDGAGSSANAVFNVTVMDAIFAPVRASFSRGTHVGVSFASNGTFLATKAGTLANDSGASVDRRRLWNGRPYLHVVNGLWAGWWVPESATVRIQGIRSIEPFSTQRRASFVAGEHIGYTFTSGGTATSSKAATLGHDSGANADRRAVINGLPYLHVVNGIWAGRWVREDRVAIASGTHTGIALEAGVVVGSKAYTLTAASGASATARLDRADGRYLAIANGVWAGYWLRESANVRLRVDLED